MTCACLPDVSASARSIQETLASLGYREVAPAPLTHHGDPSLLFANSTLVVFKGDLCAPEDRFCVQDCLRLHNSKAIARGERLEYLSSFRQAGVISTDRARDFVGEMVEVVCRAESLPPERLVVKANEPTGWAADTDAPVGAYLRGTEPPDFYRWTYGLGDICGEGVTLAVRNDDDDLLDFGNVIRLYDRPGGRWIATEYGFGLETLRARAEGRRSVVSLCEPDAAVPFGGEREHFADLVHVCRTLWDEGVRPGRSSHRSVLRQALRQLALVVVDEPAWDRAMLPSCLADELADEIDRRVQRLHHDVSRLDSYIAHAAAHGRGASPVRDYGRRVLHLPDDLVAQRILRAEGADIDG